MQKIHPVEGFVAKVDPYNTKERRLFRAHKDVPALQIKYSDSSWLLDNPVENLVSPNQQLILTEWEDGEKLLGRRPNEVFQRCIELEPYLDYVFLGDRWTYEIMSQRENRNQINRSIGIQQILGERFEGIDADFEFNPLLLGWKRWHLERHRELLDQFGRDLVGFDATGYRSKYELAKDLNQAIDVLGINGVYVSGRIGPTHLAYLPNEVKVFSGKNAILDEVMLADGEFSRELLSHSIMKRIRAYEKRKAGLRQFIKLTS